MELGGSLVSIMDDRKKTVSFFERLKISALIIVFLTLVFMILFYFVPTKISYEPLDLSLVLFLIFICIPAFFIALVTSRGFLRTGSWPLLWLGI